jgi:hypothetical protein
MRTALLTPVLALVCLSGCGEPRRFGDAGGQPVTFTVRVEKPFFSTMENRQGRPSVGAGVGFSSGGGSYSGVGVGFTFSSTQVYLLGGDAVGQADVFRQEVKWGDNTFTVPLTPGHVVQLTVQAEGGRRGWEAIGAITVPMSEPAVRVALTANGAKVEVTPAAPPATAAPAPSAATGAPPKP